MFRLFDRADHGTRRLRSKTGLKCANNCGRCCENPYVQTTVLEMLPLAIHLWQNNEAEEQLQRSPASATSGPCIFYKPDPSMAGSGRCSIYPFRPLVCRLYGYSASADKYGKPRLVTCPTIKQSQPEGYEKAQKLVDSGLPIPTMRDFSMTSFQLDPELSREQLPINEAIKIAIEKIGLYFQCEENSRIAQKVASSKLPG